MIKGQAIIFNLATTQKTEFRRPYYNQIVYFKEGFISVNNMTKEESLLLSHKRFERVCNLNEEEFQLLESNFGKIPVCVVQRSTENSQKTVFVSDDPLAIKIWVNYLGN